MMEIKVTVEDYCPVLDFCICLSHAQSFGYLVPSKEPGSKVMGVVFDSSVFPELDQKATPTTRMTVSRDLCSVS